jgi:uncharacterized protein YcgI (DUF1989 family)
VRADAAGRLTFVGSAGAGKVVEVVAEMPLLVLIANTAHPLDPRTAYTCTPLRVLAWRGGAVDPGERTPEMARALENTTAYLAMAGMH